MVSAWGGYVFIINLVPLHVLTLMLTGRFSHRIYVAYSTVYCLGTLLSMQIPFVGFQPATSSEHMAALGVFGLCQLVAFANYLRRHLSEEHFLMLFRTVILSAGIVLLLIGVLLAALGKIAPWTGRFYALLNPTYAKEHIPIIASVSEHQPTTWASHFFDLQFLTIMFPVGMYFCFKQLSDTNIFAILYGVTSLYFAGVMVRLMLVLAPIACVLGAIGFSETLARQVDTVRGLLRDALRKPSSASVPGGSGYAGRQEVAVATVVLLAIMFGTYVVHCNWVTAEAYSSPSIVLAARAGASGHRAIFDDFREAYYWLRRNTAEDAKVMSWWDYGYQITAMANRTILVDNNTWNYTHIATVGRAMASSEEKAYPVLRQLDVDYVLVWFGGLVGYASDDINKFLWMVRIGGSVYPDIKERDYLSATGEYKIDRTAPKRMLESLMYKMCYYRFGLVYTDTGTRRTAPAGARVARRPPLTRARQASRRAMTVSATARLA